MKLKHVIVPSLVLVASSAFAGAAKGPDLSALTNSIDFSTVLVGIMAVAATIVTLYAGFAGVKWILRMVKSA
ncbi:TPA: hypothetical protein OBS52_003996 [Escherichia coli]|uniref:major capsid protein n=1 Tax=Escherichia coli TaxID=562 RepID=UPI0039750AB6|nr:hypothetical protein [Escherichia coli]HCO6953234.1 hypothetical protein [Escherichia coli]